jgi:iron(III) transport system permease protein
VNGATPLQAFLRVTLPLLLPGIITGWLLAFLLGLREVVMSSLVRPASLDLLSPWIMSQFDQGNRAEALAMTVIGVFGSTLVLIIVDSWRRRQAERRLA